MSLPIAYLTSALTHGAQLITSSPDRYVNSIPVVRLGDLISCPLHGHGINPIIAVHVTQETDNMPVAPLTAIAACGATIITGSTDTYIG